MRPLTLLNTILGITTAAAPTANPVLSPDFAFSGASAALDETPDAANPAAPPTALNLSRLETALRLSLFLGATPAFDL